MRTVMRFLPVLLLAGIVLAACGHDSGTGIPDRTTVVGRISLPADSFTVQVGGLITIEAKAYDQRGASLERLPNGENFAWVSSDLNVATVQDGVVRALRPGRAIITVRAGGQLAATRIGVVNP